MEQHKGQGDEQTHEDLSQDELSARIKQAIESRKYERKFAYLLSSSVILLAPILHQELVGAKSDELLGTPK